MGVFERGEEREGQTNRRGGGEKRREGRRVGEGWVGGRSFPKSLCEEVRGGKGSDPLVKQIALRWDRQTLGTPDKNRKREGTLKDRCNSVQSDAGDYDSASPGV